MSKFYQFADNTELVNQLCERIVSVLESDIKTKGSALMAVSGGSSPKALFAELKNQNLAWEKVTIVLVDERWVPSDHADSNEAMVREHLLQSFAAKANFVGWTSDAENLDAAARVADAKFQQLSLPFSVVILGMGADGHTASWFANAPEYSSLVDTSRESAVSASQPGDAPHSRLTLNLSAVLNTESMFLQINGAEKKQVLDKAFLNMHESGLPISNLLTKDAALKIYWSAA